MKSNLTLLIVDDEPNMVLVLQDMLSVLPHRIVTAFSTEEAFKILSDSEPELVLCDLRIGAGSGIEVLKESRKLAFPPEFVFLTAHGDVETAVEALKLGAFDFLLKPAPEERLLHVLQLATEKVLSQIELANIRSLMSESAKEAALLGKSKGMLEIAEKLSRIAMTKSPVLLLGESGTGKELAAHYVHYSSPRADKPFVTLNCATLSRELFESELFGHEKGAFTGAAARRRGKFELANGGTLFLDEIGELPLELQPKLLRVLEDSVIERVGSEREFKVDVRVIAATNRDISSDVERGLFRLDLYHRLSTFSVTLPPLHERDGDAVLLAEYYLQKFSQDLGRSTLRLGESAKEALMSYRFPGNVRELRNIIERAVVMTIGSTIEAAHLHLPEDLTENAGRPSREEEQNLRAHLDEEERSVILAALSRNDWVQARAARELGLNRSHLHYKIKRLGIVLPAKEG